MRNVWTVALALVVSFAYGAGAGEHPSEHPKSKHEHPKGKKHKHEHPKGKKHKHEHPKHKGKHEHPQKEKWVSHKKLMKAFVRAVKGHVKMTVADEGSFNVYDDKLDKTWELKLIRIHKKRIARLGENKFFACADFKTVAKGKKTKIDLDFFASKDGDDWSVDEVLVHKISGKARYTYNDKNQRVPVLAKKNRKHEHPKGHEHPKKKRRKKRKSHEHPSEHPTGSEHPH